MRKSKTQNNPQESTANAANKDNKNTEESVIVVEPGNRVNYIMKDGQIRPLDVVKVWPGNKVNGVLLIDGGNDRENLPFLLEDEVSPHIILQQSPLKETPLCSIWAICVPYDEDALNMGTWHLPKEEAEEAEETMEVDYYAFVERIDKLETENQELRDWLNSLSQRFDEKITDLLAAIERLKAATKEKKEAPAP